MSLVSILAIAVALSMDALAVAFSISSVLPSLRLGHYFRLSFAFGLFQFLMPVIGWTLGLSVRDYIEAWDHWIAFVLLALVGGNMLREAFFGGGKDERERRGKEGDPTTGLSLLMLAVATSIDALAVGLSFSMLNMSIWYPAAVIGVVCAGITAAGMKLGRVLGRDVFGEKASILGGLVLLVIGVKILMEHGVFD